jgi:hypothetical protein
MSVRLSITVPTKKKFRKTEYLSFFRKSVKKFQSFFKVKGKALPLKAWIGPEGSRKVRFPDVMTTAQDGGKVISLTHRPHLSPGNTPGTHFYYRPSRH